MKLGLNLGYWGIGPQGADALEIVRLAEDAGFESVWVAESYGSDVVSILGWLAGQTERINLGGAIMQVPARPPAAAAMAGATIDALSGGRFLFGFGPSGPQVSEGWYGVPYAKPYSRTREYVEIVRAIIAREGPVEYRGEHFTLPLTEGEGVTGQGKALKLNIHPIRNRIPVFVAAIGPRSVQTAVEIGDGWIPIFFAADRFEETFGESVRKGLERAGKSRSDIEVSPSMSVAIDGNLENARNLVKATLLLYLGGMGSRQKNFYVDLASRIGFAEEARRVQDLYLEGQRDEAFQAIPEELAEATSLVGTEDEVAERIEGLRAAGVDRLIAAPASFDKAEQHHTVQRLAAICA